MAHPLVNGEMAQAALCKSQMVAALSKVLAALGPITVDRKTVMPAAVAMEPLSSSKEVLRCMGGTQLRDGKQQDASEALEHICAVLTADLAHWFRKDHAPVIYLSMAMKEVLDGTSMEGVVWRQMPSSPEKVTSSRALLSSTSGVVDERNEGIVRAEMATLKATNVSPEEGAEDSRTSCNPNLSNSALPHIRNQASPGWSGQFIRSTGCCSDPHTCSCMRDENRPSSLSVLEKNGLCSPKANCSGMQTNQTRGNDGTQALKEQVLHTSSMHTVADDSEHDEKSNHGHDVALKLEGIKSEAHKGTSGNGQAIRLEPNGDSSRSQHTDRTDHSWDGSSVDVCMLASEQETEHHGCLMQAWRQLGSCPMQVGNVSICASIVALALARQIWVGKFLYQVNLTDRCCIHAMGFTGLYCADAVVPLLWESLSHAGQPLRSPPPDSPICRRLC